MPISPLLRGSLAGSKPLPTPQQPSGNVQIALQPGAVPKAIGGALLPPPKSGTPDRAQQESATSDYQGDAKVQIADQMATGMDWAQGVLPDGSLSRVSDPRAAEMNALLADLKARTGGMTQQEMLAQQENGIASADQLLAQNMRRASDMGAASGVRGGAVAGMKMDALRDNTQARMGLQRQLILDNLAQKNQAFAAYGSALTGQQGTELGIQTYNAGKDDKEKLGRIDLATSYGGMIDSKAASNKADDIAAQGTQRATDFEERLLKMMEERNSPASGDPTKAISNRDTNAIWKSALDELKSGSWMNTDQQQASLKAKVSEYVNTAYPNITESERAQKEKEELSRLLKEGNAMGTDPVTGQALQPQKIICTEARRQRLLTAEELETSYKFGAAFLSPEELRAYWKWGRPVVKAMKASHLFARFVALFLHPLIKAEGDKLSNTKTTRFGHLVLRGFRALNHYTMSK